MRTWLINKVKNMAELDAAFKVPGKIISSGSADNPESPFIVANLSVEQPWIGMPPSARVGTIPWTLWVHDAPGSMVRIDEACLALKDNLPTQDAFMIGNMSVFEVRWTETGEDSYDDHYKTNCRPVRFAMVTHR